MFANFSFALSVTAPVFVIFCSGILLKRIGLINNEFARMGSALVFKVTLPCLLFVKLVDADFAALPLSLLAYAIAATVLVFLILDRGIAPALPVADRGAFVQGGFRGNMGIVGLAYCLNTYGEAVLPLASVYLAFMTILFNILAVITLNRHLAAGTGQSGVALITTLQKIARNPLILSIVLALSCSALEITVPALVLETLGYLAAMTLPLALLCGGAAIRWREFRTSSSLYWATLAKLVWVPGLITLGGALFGFRGQQLGVLYFMSAAPTAAASYPMVQALGGNHYLAAAVIAMTSLGSMLAITLGLFLLRQWGWV